MAAQQDQSAAALSKLNNETLSSQQGQSFPVVTLKDGSQVPTGTVGALLVNMRAYDEAHAAGDAGRMDSLGESFGVAIPVLKKLGLFELFTPDEWIEGGKHGKFGRQKVGELAKAME